MGQLRIVFTAHDDTKLFVTQDGEGVSTKGDAAGKWKIREATEILMRWVRVLDLHDRNAHLVPVDGGGNGKPASGAYDDGKPHSHIGQSYLLEKMRNSK